MAEAVPGNRHVLVTGGQRSGKSLFAERLVTASGRAAVYVATAEAGDDEMAARIALHRARRDARWRTVEEPLDLAETLRNVAGPETAVLVDCLTLWLANLYGAGRDIAAETDRLATTLDAISGAVVLVTNEVGSGVIPAVPETRAYADALGTLNQRIAAVAGRVVLVAAGQPLLLKPSQQAELRL